MVRRASFARRQYSVEDCDRVDSLSTWSAGVNDHVHASGVVGSDCFRRADEGPDFVATHTRSARGIARLAIGFVTCVGEGDSDSVADKPSGSAAG